MSAKENALHLLLSRNTISKEGEKGLGLRQYSIISANKIARRHRCANTSTPRWEVPKRAPSSPHHNSGFGFFFSFSIRSSNHIRTWNRGFDSRQSDCVIVVFFIYLSGYLSVYLLIIYNLLFNVRFCFCFFFYRRWLVYKETFNFIVDLIIVPKAPCRVHHTIGLRRKKSTRHDDLTAKFKEKQQRSSERNTPPTLAVCIEVGRVGVRGGVVLDRSSLPLLR